MKTFIKGIISFLLLVSFTGCFEFETKVRLNKDGSGTVEETFLMGKAMVEMMKQFASMGDPKTSKPFKLFDQAELKKNAVNYGKGVTFVKAEKMKTDLSEGYKVIYKFKDINELIIDQNPDSRTPMKSLAAPDTVKKTPDLTRFSFKKGSISELNILLESNKKESKADTVKPEIKQDTAASEMNEQALEFIKGMRFALSVIINGEVVETNATNRDGSNIILMEMDFGKAIDNVEKLKELESLKDADPETVKLVLKKFPGMKVELNENVSVKFK